MLKQPFLVQTACSHLAHLALPILPVCDRFYNTPPFFATFFAAVRMSLITDTQNIIAPHLAFLASLPPDDWCLSKLPVCDRFYNTHSPGYHPRQQ
jgi:hypothetical protein